MQTSTDLRNLLARIDRKGYPAYKDTRGAYQFPAYVLSIDHVQGDPFAAPSKLSIHVNGKAGRIPQAALSDPLPGASPFRMRSPASLAGGRPRPPFRPRARDTAASSLSAGAARRCWSGPPCALDPEHGDLLLRLEVGFPANGRTINARELEKDPLRPAAPVRGGVPALPQSGRKAPPGSG